VHPMVGAGSTCGGSGLPHHPPRSPEDVLLYHVLLRTMRPTKAGCLAQIRTRCHSRCEGHGPRCHTRGAVASFGEAIRRARPPGAQPARAWTMNYVFLHIWPVIDAPLEELTALQRTIAPLTAGAGIEESSQRANRTPDGQVRDVAARFSYSPLRRCAR